MSKHKEAIDEIFAQYLRDLREFAASEKTEHTDRGALEKLLKAFAAQAQGKPKVQHEPIRTSEKRVAYSRYSPNCDPYFLSAL